MKKEIDVCEVQCIHEEDVKQVKGRMLEDRILTDMAEFFKVFGDPTRIKILYILFQKEMCVCDIAAVLELQQSAVSHQLRILKNKRLVKYRREGKVVYYTLDDNHIKRIFDEGLSHIQHS
ncbi:ArsR/SmtB family transcription factor [Natronincola ferrireducens]|uniref:Regulatory protein, arsR family n=1 Tax=Natronincola ferrireducens TaxID=393762 RepID=A0A1G9H356_9FIRM|nr:metalloregulator ArsR/SmtB family transcription factor [Natronincola ferrireducens]SDL06933.1 regulatory protein, arsR family [Natronincola ferrireducens]